jgi:hypothetical protein
MVQSLECINFFVDEKLEKEHQVIEEIDGHPSHSVLFHDWIEKSSIMRRSHVESEHVITCVIYNSQWIIYVSIFVLSWLILYRQRDSTEQNRTNQECGTHSFIINRRRVYQYVAKFVFMAHPKHWICPLTSVMI